MVNTISKTLTLLLWTLVPLASFGSGVPSPPDTPARPVAKVGRTLIDTHDVHDRLNRLKQTTTAHQADRYEQAINQLIDEAILIQQAKKLGLHRTKDYADGLETAKQTLLLELMIGQLLATYIGVSEAEANQFYRNNARLFSAIHQRRFHYSLSDTAAEAKQAYAQLSKNPDALPLTYGGWITKNHPDPAIAEAVFSLTRIGDIAPPIRTPNGYYVIQLMGINHTPKQTKADSLALIKSELQFDQRNALIDAYIREARKTITVHRY